jgi:hypothetical protein
VIRSQRAPSTLSSQAANAMPMEMPPNSTPEYTAKTRPASADGTRWPRKLLVATVSKPFARPPAAYAATACQSTAATPASVTPTPVSTVPASAPVTSQRRLSRPPASVPATMPDV